MKKSIITGVVAAAACLLSCKLLMGMMMGFKILLCALLTGGIVFAYCHFICKCNKDDNKCDSKKKK